MQNYYNYNQHIQCNLLFVNLLLHSCFYILLYVPPPISYIYIHLINNIFFQFSINCITILLLYIFIIIRYENNDNNVYLYINICTRNKNI